MDIGQRIKEARIEKRMTQEELGQAVGVQKSAIAKYEAGKVVNIKRSVILKLAKALDMRPSDFIFTGGIDSAADLHAKIISDTQAVSMMSEYYGLSAADQKIVRAFVHSLSEKPK